MKSWIYIRMQIAPKIVVFPVPTTQKYVNTEQISTSFRVILSQTKQPITSSPSSFKSALKANLLISLCL